MAERGARLLVADDNKVNRLLLGRTLELQGHQVSSADNGRRALEMLRSERFELLLLDLEMPELDGFAVLEQLAADADLRDLPVIVTSSLEGVAQVARCIELGADDYLHKPVNPVLLKARVGSSLEKKRLAAVRAALDMIEMVQLFNAERASEGKPPIAIGIGIGSGEVIAGYTGTQQRATYTCVGDTVNLAARLEAQTKAAGHAVLVDAATQAALAGRVASTPLGPMAIRGKAAEVPVHAVKTAR